MLPLSPAAVFLLLAEKKPLRPEMMIMYHQIHDLQIFPMPELSFVNYLNSVSGEMAQCLDLAIQHGGLSPAPQTPHECGGQGGTL